MKKTRVIILLLLTALLVPLGSGSALAHPGHGVTSNRDDGYSFVYWYYYGSTYAADRIYPGEVSNHSWDVSRVVVPPCRKFTYDRNEGTNATIYNWSTTDSRSLYVANDEHLRVLNIERIC
jgi:hypothetical protein